MAFIIKAGTPHPGLPSTRRAEFNFEDVSQQATDYLNSVKQQAAAILARARQEAEQVRAQATQAGLDQALEEARAIAQGEAAEKWTGMKPALEKLIQGVQQAREDWIRDWEKRVARLAVAIAEKLVHHQLRDTPSISHQWIREALELAAGNRQLKVYLNPAEHAALGDQRTAIAEVLQATTHAEFVPDPSIESGGCRVVTEHGEIDSRLEAQLARIEEELTE